MMQKQKKLRLLAVLTIALTFALSLLVACGGKTDDGKKPEPSEKRAAYKTEYYLESDDGYALDVSRSETLEGKVGDTVTIERKTIDGYVFESANTSNVLRGRILEDGSLVLKAYYSKDYTGLVTFERESDEAIDIIKGSETPLGVTVKVNGVAVTGGVTYQSSYKVVTVDENGTLKANMRGEAEITVTYKNVSETYPVTVWDGFIATEADWWAIYDHPTYWYKFTADVTLTQNTIDHFAVPAEGDDAGTPGHLVNKDFKGVIDGGNHSLTYSDARLFHWYGGAEDSAMRNITINASNGFYWGSTIAYGVTGATIENVNVNASFVHEGMFRAVNADFWIKLGGDEGVTGYGGMFGMMESTTVKNCNLNLDMSALSDVSHFGAVAYSAQSNCVVENCKVVSTAEDVKIVDLDKDETTTITNCSSSVLEKAEYKIEYYLEGDDGYVHDVSKDETLEEYVGKTVTATPKAIAGYAFEADNADNVTSGVIDKDNVLVLKLYYKKSNITFETDTAEAFEAVKGETVDLNVTVKADGVEVTSGVEYAVDNAAVASVENGTVTMLKGGVVKVTVRYAGSEKEFTVTIWDKYLATEEDWWGIYASEETLGGIYKLTADITLVGQVVTQFGETSYQLNHTFAGVVEGNGKTLTYHDSKLFTTITGTFRNVTLTCTGSCYWGSNVAYFLSGATFENVTLNAEFGRSNTYWFSGGFIEASGAGAFGVWVDGTTFKNCNVTVTYGGDATNGFATTAYWSGIGYEVKNSTLENVTVKSATEGVKLYATGTGNTETNAKVEIIDDSVLISTEEEWWAIYASETTLAGKYKLANDLTLTGLVVTQFGDESYKLNHTFTGTIDGNGKTLTYHDSKLFTSITGTFRNITLTCTGSCYWGSNVAYFLTGATFENVTLNAEFGRENTYWWANDFIAAPGAGAFGVWIDGTTFKNCNVTVTYSGAATTAYWSGIGYEVKNSTLENVTVKSATDGVKLYATGEGNTETNAKIEKIA